MKIYIVCPGNLTTGGAEALHQLCDALNSNGAKAYMLYVLKGKHARWLKIPKKYLSYKIRVARKRDRKPPYKVVIPESMCEWISQFQAIQTYVWWLSVDYNNYQHFNSLNINITHLYQSNYAYNYLMKMAYNPAFSLSDYNKVKPEHIEELKIPKDFRIVLSLRKVSDEYNALCQKIIANLNPIIIKDLEYSEVQEELKKASILVDFGFFPGKDRLPREAFIAGCNVVISNLGAAKNELDFPNVYFTKIPSSTTFEEFLEVLNGFTSTEVNESDRSKFKNQEENIFRNEVRSIFFSNREYQYRNLWCLTCTTEMFLSTIYWILLKLIRKMSIVLYMHRKYINRCKE